MTPELRALFPITQHAVYLNHAAVSPPPTTTIKAVEAQLRDVHENGSLNFHSWLAVKERARELLAGLLGARPDQVAFMRNTSDGLSTVANGLEWKQPLVPRTGSYVNELRSNVERRYSQRLNYVHHEQRVVLPREPAEALQVRAKARGKLDVADGDQPRVLIDQAGEFIEVDSALALFTQAHFNAERVAHAQPRINV